MSGNDPEGLFPHRDWSGISHDEIIRQQGGELRELMRSPKVVPDFDVSGFEPVERGVNENVAVGPAPQSTPVPDPSLTDEFESVTQPNVYKKQKLTDEDPVIRAEWEIKEFVWFSQFLDDLPEVYELLLKRLDVNPVDYDYEIGGFYRYKHKHDKKRHCDVESIYVPLVKCGRYHPYASVKHRRRASMRTLDRLEFLEQECKRRRVRFDYLIKIELTLPKFISHRWNDTGVQSRIREAVKDFLSELHSELFPGHDSQFGVVSNHHYWASRSPLEPHRHVHLSIPNVTYNRNTGMFHRFRPWIGSDLVRRIWKKVLVKNNLWVDVQGNTEPDVFVGYINFEERDRVIHRLSYCNRKPIEDLVKNLGYSDLEDFDEDFAEFLICYTPRVINLGFLTNLKRFGYSRKSNVLKCPICEGDMVPERDKFERARLYDRPPPELPSLYRSRGGEWLRVPSPKDFAGGEEKWKVKK